MSNAQPTMTALKKALERSTALCSLPFHFEGARFGWRFQQQIKDCIMRSRVHQMMTVAGEGTC